MHFVHYHSFDTRAKQYDDHIIRVAEDTATSAICGVVCVGLKRVWLHGTSQLVGYIFDLRVDQDYQGLGIGKRLSKDLESLCRARGVTALYLTVNSDNARARALYTKQGFVHASYRSPALQVLVQPQPPSAAAAKRVRRISPDLAAQLTERYYAPAGGGTDLFPSEVAVLMAGPAGAGAASGGTPLYEGTWLLAGEKEAAPPAAAAAAAAAAGAAEGSRGDTNSKSKSQAGRSQVLTGTFRPAESYAGVSLWNGSALGGVKLETRRHTGLLLGLCLACAAVAAWTFALSLLRAAARDPSGPDPDPDPDPDLDGGGGGGSGGFRGVCSWPFAWRYLCVLGLALAAHQALPLLLFVKVPGLGVRCEVGASR